MNQKLEYKNLEIENTENASVYNEEDNNFGKLDIDRYFSDSKKNPYDKIKWNYSDATIKDEMGKILFIQKETKWPEYFSGLARDIIASRYFYGQNGTEERESSLKDLIERVTDSYRKWAVKQNYFNQRQAEIFKEELATLTLNQMMAFNSPVWFNVGTDKYASRIRKEGKGGYGIIDGKVSQIPIDKDHLYPQTSACFIQSVGDSMEEIMQLATNEAMLFKFGSGTGTDLSTLRSFRETLGGGGKPSGPLEYESFYDRVAGIVKSGGKTRRAAKMNSLKIDHPDIKEFIEAKMPEEDVIRVLMLYKMSQGKSYNEARKFSLNHALYQNANLSVRVTDEFMKAVEEDKEWQTKPVHSHDIAEQMPKYKARDLWNLIAQCTWECGDPGMQYDTTINKWHTCPNSEPINASNPCSEYMFIDNSACNLASIRLRKFQRKGQEYDIKGFKNAVKTMVIAQELNIDNSGYPTLKIAENAHKFRPIGAGYSDLGALLMTEALPYDSDKARAVAASLTALLTGTGYLTSAEMAEKIGAFKEYEKNKDPMMNVIKMHRDKLKDIDKDKLPNEYKPVLKEAKKVWEKVVEKGEEYGFRNSQISVLAPAGTISFMMDCDTTGIEPDIALVKYKNLAEGGLMRIVNQSIEPALEKLGYNEEQIKDINTYIIGHETVKGAPNLKPKHYLRVEKSNNKKQELKKLGYNEEQIKEIIGYIDGYGTVEGSPHLKPEHLPVFDCAFKSKGFKRIISPYGHVKMMAAVQPFISGAISKTVNLEEDSTPEDIANLYKIGHEMGLKALALYRDNSKATQILSTSKSSNEKSDLEKLLGIGGATRRELPITRDSKTHKFNVAGQKGYFTIGLYDDGKPGELFINISKEGSTIGGWADAFGTAISYALQYGVSLEDLIKKFRHQRFDPRGLVYKGHPDVKKATSIVDYIFNTLGHMFIEDYQEEKNLIDEGDKSISKQEILKNDIQSALGQCIQCGGGLYEKDHCKSVCEDCGFVDTKGCG